MRIERRRQMNGKRKSVVHECVFECECECISTIKAEKETKTNVMKMMKEKNNMDY